MCRKKGHTSVAQISADLGEFNLDSVGGISSFLSLDFESRLLSLFCIEGCALFEGNLFDSRMPSESGGSVLLNQV
jgi:hypothetical protein